MRLNKIRTCIKHIIKRIVHDLRWCMNHIQRVKKTHKELEENHIQSQIMRVHTYLFSRICFEKKTLLLIASFLFSVFKKLSAS